MLFRSSSGSLCTLANPRHLLAHLVRTHLGYRRRVHPAGPEIGIDGDDVGLAAGGPQYPRTSAAEDERRVRSLNRRGHALEVTDLVVLALVSERRRSEEALDDSDALLP